ncbi:hypothetical protein RF11_12826 [Thelohanellus kitauei]|uniref:Uncharacterized protein n=1 Tax=Thelohanellus kitauei TaxID=669202 RepID=A0A0C2MIB7_THEKT|nr:hypothetical protein RF11_12826 [Thelohanellus kitauei]
MRHSFPLRSAVSANTTRENPLLAKLRELPNWNLQNEAFALLVIKLESIVHLTTKQFDWSSPSHDVILLLFYKKSEIFGAPVAVSLNRVMNDTRNALSSFSHGKRFWFKKLCWLQHLPSSLRTSTQHRFNHIKIWRTTDDPSESILSLIARFGSLGPTVNNRKSAAVLTRIAHPTSDLAFPVVTSEKPYKYLAVREVAKPLNGLNVEGCVRKLFGIAEKFVSCGHLNALNTVRSINYFALSHLWFLFAML